MTLPGAFTARWHARAVRLCTWPPLVTYALRPPCREAVAICADAEDIYDDQVGARSNTPFAVRGGGHNYTDGSGNTRHPDQHAADKCRRLDGTTLHAQSGVRSADLATLLPQGGVGRLLLPGGTCPGVGVAGLTLGGGIGPHAR